MSKAQKQETAESIRETSSNSIWPKHEGTKSQRRRWGWRRPGQLWEPVQAEEFMHYPEGGDGPQAVSTFLFSPRDESPLCSWNSQKGAWPSRKNQASGSLWRILSRRTLCLNFPWKLILAAMWKMGGGPGGVACSSPGKRREAPHENKGFESTRDLATNICMPAGCVTLFVPCPESQKSCQLKREGRGENVWLYSSKIQYSHTLLNNRVAL